MGGLELGAVFGDQIAAALGITGFRQVTVGDAEYLLAISRSGLSVFGVPPGQTPQLMSEATVSGPFQPGVEPTIAVIPDGAQNLVVVSGPLAGPAFFGLDPEGTVSPTVPPPGWPGGATTALEMTIDGIPCLLATGTTISPTILELSPATTQALTFASSSATEGTVLAMTDVPGEPMLVTADDAGKTIRTLLLSGDGMLQQAGSIGAQDGLGIAGVQTGVLVQIMGQSFLIVAGGGSSSLTALSVDAGGALNHTDHIVDSLDTRFQAVGALTTASVGDRLFVFAGGADDGVSAFVLLPGGRLFHIGAVEDTTTATLENVSALTARQMGDHLVVTASSATEQGLTQITLPLADLGETYQASDAGGQITGTSWDDILSGGSGADDLKGDDGDDLISDGAGLDLLTGGAGADVFILAADGATDRITDFERGLDRIDLSWWPMLYDRSVVGIATTATGAELTFRDEFLLLDSADGNPLVAQSVRDSLLLDIDRPTFVQATRFSLGTDAPDTLTGSAADDDMRAKGGADLLDSGDGDDILIGDAGDDTLLGGPGGDYLVGGWAGRIEYGDAFRSRPDLTLPPPEDDFAI